MSEKDKLSSTPKEQFISAILSVIPDATMRDAVETWNTFNDMIYDHAAMSDIAEIAEADCLAVVLNGKDGDLIPLERDQLS